MKRIIALFAITWLSLGLLRSEADDLSIDVFYNQLEPYGDWVDAGDYGYVWHPRDAGDDWRPYTDGHWAYTDAGWTWLSEEPYSWAVYHYGRWTKIVDLGWAWVPGTEWGPAWVSFRYSDRHVGWAPLPPEAEFRGDNREIGAWSDSYYDVGPTDYVFVDVRDFGAPRLRDVELPYRENVTMIDETTNITNIRVENNVIFNGGPEYDVMSRGSAQKIPRLRLERRTDGFGSDPNAFHASVQGNSLRVAAPAIAAAAASVVPSKVARKLQNVQINHGWKDAGDPAAVQKLRAKLKTEAKAPAGLPPQPKFQRAATAPGGTAAPAGRPARVTEAPVSPTPGKTAAPVEKSAAEAKPQKTQTAPAREPIAPQKTIPKPEPQIKPEERAPKSEAPSRPEEHATKPEPRVKPEERAVRPEAQVKPEERAVRPEAQVKPEERAVRPEAQVKPEERAVKPEAKVKPEEHRGAPPAADGDKGKKKDDKKPE